jgi:hypothetical protein
MVADTAQPKETAVETRKAKFVVPLASIALLLIACVPVIVPGRVGVEVPAPYYYSPSYCAGCWYGEWGGRTGYHRGGGQPWEREHFEPDHHGENRGSDVRHEGHR